ncbi:pentapeptide repeat-containing protein [uncultured Christiangramia sp.]|uniref:pentapeptide repeat-containing protein n=1 Tax=uncultured Christiangramia sp. TaxID=503836 RepID=UPI0025D77F8F|nr:pentapeptide repeat-containing protein [uncultured Christiangramia sp.]
MNRFLKHWPIKILVIVFIGFLVCYLILNDLISHWAYPTNENRNGELLKDFLAASGGLAVLAGLYISFVRSRAMERNVVNQEEQIKNQTVEIGLSRDSLLNEQFKNAVEHLGSDNEPIILGGIAELNFLATNQEEKFSEIVKNIFCSYCKSEAHYKKHEDSIKWNVIRAIIENLSGNKAYAPFQVDLAYTNLFGTRLQHSELSNWDFSYSTLPKKIHRVIFKRCNFTKCNLIIARHIDVSFEWCQMSFLYMENLEWSQIAISGKSTFSATSIDSSFKHLTIKSEFYSSKFFNCNIENSNFGKSFLSDTHFLCCDFNKVSFRNSEMMSNRFDASNFKKVIFRGFVTKTSFKGIRNEDSRGQITLWSKIIRSIEGRANFAGVTFSGLYKDLADDTLTKHDCYFIVQDYNDILKTKGGMKNKVIDIPQEWLAHI